MSTLLDARLARKVADARLRGLHVDPQDTDRDVTDLAVDYARAQGRLVVKEYTRTAIVRIKIERLCMAEAWLPFDGSVANQLRQLGIHLSKEWNMADYNGEAFLPALLPRGWSLRLAVGREGPYLLANRMQILDHRNQIALAAISVFSGYPQSNTFTCEYRRQA
ncbi:MAG: hypothetical protein PVI21_04930 [Candidatus Woesebacteria bacterium]|jgi:hypothetical protein